MNRPKTFRSGLFTCHLMLGCLLLIEFRPLWPWNHILESGSNILYAAQFVLAVAWAVLAPRTSIASLLPLLACSLLAWPRLALAHRDAAEMEFAYCVVLVSIAAMIAWIARQLGWRVFVKSHDGLSVALLTARGNWQFSLASLLQLTLFVAGMLLMTRWLALRFEDLSLLFLIVAAPIIAIGMTSFFAVLSPRLSRLGIVAWIAGSMAIAFAFWSYRFQGWNVRPILLTIGETAAFLPTLIVLRVSGVRCLRVQKTARSDRGEESLAAD